MIKIENFTEHYAFLSNFFPSEVQYRGMTYLNNESAFQAQKLLRQVRPCSDRTSPQGTYQSDFSRLQPRQAKTLGRKVKLRPDWENLKVNIMYEIVHAKFIQNAALAQKLLDTDNALLIEGNTWGDYTWGMVNGNGQNLLGKILMQVRREIKNMPPL